MSEAIGWALLHFVWQGALIGVISAVVLAALRRSAADVRYVVSTIALAVMLTMPVMTAVQRLRADADCRPAGTSSRIEPGGQVSGASVQRPAGAVVGSPVPQDGIQNVRTFAVEAWLPVFVTVWAAGVLLLTLRLASTWVYVQRLKTRGAVAADAALQTAAARLARRLHLTWTVRLLQSSIVEVPTVIGWLKPVVLLPVGALAGLTTTQLEAILAHELAHIRRHDYVVNLLQTLVETLLFYHPAVWWLSGRIRAERENCCDDLAVILCGDRYEYARALAELEGLRGSAGGLVVAATGGSLLQRVRRLLGAPSSHAGRGPGWLAGGAAIVLMFGIAASQTLATQTPVAPAAQELRKPATPPAQVRAFAEVARVRALADSVSTAAPALAAAAAEAATVQAATIQAAAAVAFGSGPQSSGNVSWSSNGLKLEANYRGEFEFSDDDTDVKRMSPGSHLKISDGGWLRSRSVEFTADQSGNITRRFWVGMSERPFEPEGRQWLAQSLPRFVRQTGIGAKARVARIYKAQGVQGVLGEISKIDGSWAKRVYFKELFQLNVEPGTLRQAVEQAGREIESDFELASLLIDSGDKLLADESTRRAYFDAARSIQSDFEMRRTFASALKRGPVGNGTLVSMLDSARNIDSDYELASLLVQAAKLQSLEPARSQYFAALATIESDYEHRRALAALGERPDLSSETVVAMLNSAVGMSSDFERASFLLQMAKIPIEGVLREPFFKAVNAMGSDYERGRVLLAIAGRADASNHTVIEVLRSAKGMSSGFEAGRVLQTVARNYTLSGEARDAYIEASDRLGDYEQGRALAALVRSEKRK